MSLYQTDNGLWVIGSGGCWLPGTYATKKAARYAFQFPDKVLREVRDRCLPNPITAEDLREAKRRMSEGTELGGGASPEPSKAKNDRKDG